ncbi:MAG TPA: response regulator transcription factor [Steroidobacteraceae bacterium]|nr:response regulator transcription factor [Steroidobacteraceae bacterium]
MSKPNEAPSHRGTIYVVDDDDGMRRALTLLLGTVGFDTRSFARPSEFLANLKPDEPGCLVLDIRMPEMSGLELQQQLNQTGCMLPVIFITGHGDVPMAVQAMKAGAFEFIQKPFREQDLLDKVNHALHHDAENRQTLARRAEVLKHLATLTPRERQVMDLVVDGGANKVIAIDLGLSERTVEIHRAKVMEKMGARSVAHLVKLHMMLAE